MRRFACFAVPFSLVAPLVCSAHLIHAQASDLLRKANSGNVGAFCLAVRHGGMFVIFDGRIALQAVRHAGEKNLVALQF